MGFFSRLQKSPIEKVDKEKYTAKGIDMYCSIVAIPSRV
jgi:hypothetical protein